DLALFRRPVFVGSAVAVFMSRMLTIGGTVYLVQYFHGALHLDPTAVGLLLLPVFVAQIGAGMLGGKLLGRFHPGYVIAAGNICKVAGAVGLALAATPTAPAWLLVGPLLVWGTGGGLAGAPVFAVAMNVTEKRHAGMVAGTISSLASIGAGIGTAGLGVVYGSAVGAPPAPESIATATALVLTCSAALAVLATVAVLILISKRNLRTADLPKAG
ncbi:MAG: MFS transporter, partial [Actinomycetes bacterium]